MSASTATPNPEAAPERSRLYWFFFHLRRRTVGALWQWTRRNPLLGGITYVVLLALLYAFRASYQPAFLFLRKYFVLALAIGVLLYLLHRVYRRAKTTGKIMVVLTTAALAAGVWFWGAPMVNYLASYYHYRSLNKVELAELPLTGHERIQPLNSVATMADQEALNETQSASSPDFIRRADGRFDFSMAVGPSPDYPLQRLTRPVDQIISVSATSPAPDFSADNRYAVHFDVGEQLLFGRNVRGVAIRKFSLGQYLSCQPDQVRFMEDDQGRWVQVVSLVRWKGFLFPRPVFGGVLVMDQRTPGPGAMAERIFLGRGRYYSPQALASIGWLKGQNLLPERASRFTAQSFRFHRGFLAPFPGYHEGDVRIPQLPDDLNGMPYVTWFNFDGVAANAENGLYDYYGLEPFLVGKSGLNLSLFLPGDGSPEVFFMDHSRLESGLFGSSAVPVKVRESRKEYDWSASAAVESRPFIRDIGDKRRFFWLTTVVTRSDAGSKGFVGGSMPDITLTDALGRQVVWVDRQQIADTRLWEQQIIREIGANWGLPDPSQPSAPEASQPDSTP